MCVCLHVCVHMSPEMDPFASVLPRLSEWQDLHSSLALLPPPYRRDGTPTEKEGETKELHITLYTHNISIDLNMYNRQHSRSHCSSRITIHRTGLHTYTCTSSHAHTHTSLSQTQTVHPFPIIPTPTLRCIIREGPRRTI